jgi:caffeoyl-CoA O-methyltransferase
MPGIVSEELEDYVGRHCVPADALKQALKKETYEKTSAPGMQSGQVEGTLLRMLVQLSGARRVLEIGTFTGYSALSMAEGLPDDGELITCDIDPEATAMAQKYWDQSPHGAKIRLRLAPALDTIATLEDGLDFVFIDADKHNYPNYYEACLPKVRTGGLIAVDNVLWSGAVLDPQDETTRIIDQFNQTVAADDRVDVVMLTVRDGITLARKR